MKYFTMVARTGDPKASANMYSYTLVSDAFTIHNITGDKLIEKLNDEKIKVTNLTTSSKGLISTNGSLSRYTAVDKTGKLLGKARYVILNRVETNGKLSGYVAYTDCGTVVELSIADAVNLLNNDLIANGKVRHTITGDIVSSIGGNYPLTNIKVSEIKDSKPTLDIVMFGRSQLGKKYADYFAVNINTSSAKTLTNLHDSLLKCNKTLISKLEAFGIDNLDNYAIRPTCNGGFYGIYPLDVLKKLKEKSSNIRYSIKTPMVSFVDCSDNFNESILTVNPKTKQVVKQINGSEKSDAGANKFLDKIKDIL